MSQVGVEFECPSCLETLRATYDGQEVCALCKFNFEREDYDEQSDADDSGE